MVGQLISLKTLVLVAFETRVLVHGVPPNLELLELVDPILNLVTEQHEAWKDLMDSRPGLRVTMRTNQMDNPEIQFWRTLPRVSAA